MTDTRDEFAKAMLTIQGIYKQSNSRQVHIYRSQLDAIARSSAAERAGDREQHLTWTIANEAYQLILDENLGAKESLIKAASHHTEEVDAVLSEKSNPSNGLNKRVVSNNDKHPIQKDMVKRKKFNRQGIKNAKNVWQMLNMLSYFREAYNEALDLEKVKEDISYLKTDMVLAQEEVARLQQNTGNYAMSGREKASLLKRKGYNQVEVASSLKVNKSTVCRWWDSL